MYYIFHYNGFQLNYLSLVFARKNGFLCFLRPLLLSELKMGIEYTGNISDHKKSLFFFKCVQTVFCKQLFLQIVLASIICFIN